MGSLSFWLERPVVLLRTRDQVRSFLRRKNPVFLVDCRKKEDPVLWPRGEPEVGWYVAGRNGKKRYTLIANVAAAAAVPPPQSPPPGGEASREEAPGGEAPGEEVPRGDVPGRPASVQSR